VAMKPLDGTFAQNAERWGVAGINVDGCRVDGGNRPLVENTASLPSNGIYGEGHNGSRCVGTTGAGRWPANLIHDGSEEVVRCFPHDAARFFYCAKASRAERELGLEGMAKERQFRLNAEGRGAKGADGDWDDVTKRWITAPRANSHPCCKPLSLMRYLVRLTKTPTGGPVLDPFTGGGTTGVACMMEGRDFIGIELNEEYCAIARRRIAAVSKT